MAIAHPRAARAGPFETLLDGLVAHAAIRLHVDRLEAGAVGRRHVAIRALQARAEAVAGAQGSPHLGDAAARIEVERVREFEVAHLARMIAERDALELRLLAVPARQDEWAELGMAAGEIGRAGLASAGAWDDDRGPGRVTTRT